MSISNDVELPEAVPNWLPTATAKRIQDLDDIVPDTFRAAALDFLDTPFPQLPDRGQRPQSTENHCGFLVRSPEPNQIWLHHGPDHCP